MSLTTESLVTRSMILGTRGAIFRKQCMLFCILYQILDSSYIRNYTKVHWNQWALNWGSLNSKTISLKKSFFQKYHIDYNEKKPQHYIVKLFLKYLLCKITLHIFVHLDLQQALAYVIAVCIKMEMNNTSNKNIKKPDKYSLLYM